MIDQESEADNCPLSWFKKKKKLKKIIVESRKKVGGPSSLERRIQRPSRAPLSFLNSVVVFLVMFLPGLTVLVCFFRMKINIFDPFSSSSLCYISLFFFTFSNSFFLLFLLYFLLSPLVQITLYSPHLLFVRFNFSNILHCPYIS